jgi:hypothetical protein
MKTICFSALISIALFSCNTDQNSQEKTDSTSSTTGVKKVVVDAENAAVITFEEAEFDFGDLKQGDEVHHIFKFKNTGKSNLIIETATAPCGCTVPSWPKEPIAPGAAGEIDVKFNSTGKEGIQNKVVTVTANTVPNTTTVKIMCNVLKK